MCDAVIANTIFRSGVAAKEGGRKEGGTEGGGREGRESNTAPSPPYPTLQDTLVPSGGPKRVGQWRPTCCKVGM